MKDRMAGFFFFTEFFLIKVCNFGMVKCVLSVRWMNKIFLSIFERVFSFRSATSVLLLPRGQEEKSDPDTRQTKKHNSVLFFLLL